MTKNKIFAYMLGSICISSAAFCSDSSLTRTNFSTEIGNLLTTAASRGVKSFHFKWGGDTRTKETSLTKTETTETSDTMLYGTSKAASSSSKTKTSFGVSASIGGKGGSANVGGGTRTYTTSNESVTERATQNGRTIIKIKEKTKDIYKDGINEVDGNFFHYSSQGHNEEDF